MNYAKLALIACILLLPACASKHMTPVLDTEKPVIANANDAVVVFMRPSMLGGAIQSSVFDVTNQENKFIGIVSTDTKVAYATQPGPKTFMVIGESADFAKAELEAGKTYYMLVTPRMGFWKARFSLRPVTKTELNGEDFAEWSCECAYVKNSTTAELWAKENALDIQNKRTEYYKDWMEKPEIERPLLRSTDGIPTELNAQ
nr:hypothetical protein [Pseudodesulfovibrio sp.]